MLPGLAAGGARTACGPHDFPFRRESAVRLDADDIEAVAARVVALLRDGTEGDRHYVDAATLARILGVRRGWVYSRARELGGVRLGDGPRAPLRFDIERVRVALG